MMRQRRSSPMPAPILLELSSRESVGPSSLPAVMGVMSDLRRGEPRPRKDSIFTISHECFAGVRGPCLPALGRNIAVNPTIDPHCGRSSDEWLIFDAGGTAWAAQWGRYDVFGTLAFWVDQTVRAGYEALVASWAKDGDLLHETVFCLLGGYGVTAEVCHAANRAVRESLDLASCPSAEEVEEVLLRPLPGMGVRYRFPRQRSARIAAAVKRVLSEDAPADPLALRSYLTGFDGIGLKTASWIVRNLTGSRSVAIIDIWLVRALVHAGVFRPEWRVERDYLLYERAFLQYASYGNVHPGGLDACIWEQARIVGASYFDGTRYARHATREVKTPQRTVAPS